MTENGFGYGFIPSEFLPSGKDEFYLRNEEAPVRPWRALSAGEKAALAENGNYAPDWNDFLVADPFDPRLIRNSVFYGLVRLGPLEHTVIQRHDFALPSGIRNSMIISSDIGANCAIYDCSYLSHYIIGDRVILSGIDEMQTTNHSKFGNGVLMPGEDEEVRVWIDVMNEAGGRSILPFDGMICADAFLWAAFRDDRRLVEALKDLTQKQYGGPRGRYGTAGNCAVIKSCRIIKDCAIGDYAYIKGANKLKNLTIHSSEDEASQIGEGVELVNGIIGFGCHIFYGVKAVRFVMGRNSSLKYGARLIHSVLGDNSTVSCCEILNNLIFPVHEQHHNNSFLVAGLIQGLSNMAAGATIGSNHNSRANDGEIRAGRGFWPGLSVTLKHSSRFASFVLISKGDYPYEMNIPLPFSLVNHNVKYDRVEVMPAYFWMYNMYALERNAWKAKDRDRRKKKIQYIETAYLAPDTAEEIINARELLSAWIARDRENPRHEQEDSIIVGGLERNKRKQAVLKPSKALDAYNSMLGYYVFNTFAEYLFCHGELDFAGFAALAARLDAEREKNAESGRVSEWVNMGGQIVPAFRVDRLRSDIGRYSSWHEIHDEYSRWVDLYELDKLSHAWSLLALLEGGAPADRAAFIDGFGRLRLTKRWICDQVYESRAKDFLDPFRKITYRNQEEMDAVAGKAGDNFFVKRAKEKLESFEVSLKTLLEHF
ncbi:MAG: DUF4954 family protein [Spirochaetaceae bacterium]|jgi:hypothetical protein|nr:DUF4954 family protein [Spirochaetaceae bacterium]